MIKQLQLFITLDQKTKLWMDIDMPFVYDDAFLEVGTYPVDAILDGYVHIFGQGLIKLTPKILVTCPHYIQDDYGYCHWHSDCMRNLCLETCILNLKSEKVPTMISP